MPKTQDEQLRVRLNAEMMRQIDSLTDPYLGTNRSDVIRALLSTALMQKQEFSKQE